MRGDDKKKKKDGKESKDNIGRCKWEAHLSELQFHKPKQDINIFLLNSDFIQGWAISAFPAQAKLTSEKKKKVKWDDLTKCVLEVCTLYCLFNLYLNNLSTLLAKSLKYFSRMSSTPSPTPCDYSLPITDQLIQNTSQCSVDPSDQQRIITPINIYMDTETRWSMRADLKKISPHVPF